MTNTEGKSYVRNKLTRCKQGKNKEERKDRKEGEGAEERV